MPRSRGSNISSLTAPFRISHTRDGPVVVSSSSPSFPRNTSPRLPRLASTPATSGAIRSLATPTAEACTWAGLIMGPRKLKAVGTPSSRRATAACRIEGWNTWAKQKVMPASSALRATRGIGRSSRTPRASRTSADPEVDDAARLPCLTTLAPAPAAISAAMVEMLTVFCWSPPVPTMSSFSPGDLNGARVGDHRLDQARRVRPRSRPWTAAPRGIRRPGPAWPPRT